MSRHSTSYILYDPVNQDGSSPQPVHVYLPGQTVQQTGTDALSGPLVVDDTFLTLTTMPLFAAAQGYTSAAQVWSALKNQAGVAVMRYDNRLKGLPTADGFAPFTIEVPQSSASRLPIIV